MGNKNAQKKQRDKNENINKIDNNDNFIEYNKNIDYKFIHNPIVKFRKNLTDKNDAYGVNDVFEIYLSYKDSKQYIVSPNAYNYKLDIFTLKDSKKIKSLKGHKTLIISVRYFINNNNYEEYLISSDYNRRIIIWEINNNNKIKYNINTNYKGDIYSCLMCFPSYENDGFFITSTYHSSISKNSATKIFSLKDGKLFRCINESNDKKIVCLLEWQNMKNEKYYIIQLAESNILINSLENEHYAKLNHSPESCYYYGYIDKDFLFTASWNGYVKIWNLYTKQIFKVIITGEKSKLTYILKWNDRYSIVSDLFNKSFIIIDMKQYKVISKILSGHSHALKSIKKVLHPIYGESLLSASYDKTIKIWSV